MFEDLETCAVPAAMTGPRFHYRAFGLSIVSDVELSELDECEPGAVPDVDIVRRSIAWPGDRRTPTDFRFSDNELLLHWDTVGTFRVVGDGTIEVSPNDLFDPRLFSFPILGPIMALLLHRRGLLVMHASAVVLDGACAIFLGDKGAGKSTTAGALIERGHSLVSDDVVAIDLTDPARPMVLPAFPQLKLTFASASAIALPDARVGESLHPAIEKRQHRLRSNYVDQAAPLGAIYALERSDSAAVVSLNPAEGLPVLLKFSYVARFERSAMGKMAGRHLAACASLAVSPGVKRLKVVAGLDKLTELATSVERNIAQPRQA